MYFLTQAKQSHFLSLEVLIQLENSELFHCELPSICISHSSHKTPSSGRPQGVCLSWASVLLVPWLLTLRLGKKKTRGWKISTLKGEAGQDPGRTWQAELTAVPPLADTLASALSGTALRLCSIRAMLHARSGDGSTEGVAFPFPTRGTRGVGGR